MVKFSEMAQFSGNAPLSQTIIGKRPRKNQSIVLELVYRLCVVRIDLASTDKALEVQKCQNSHFFCKNGVSPRTFELKELSK